MIIELLKSKKPIVGLAAPCNLAERLVQMTVTGKGIVKATAFVEVSNDRKKWFTVCLPMTVTGDATNEPVSDMWPNLSVTWAFMRATCTAIEGEGAEVTLTMAMIN